MIVTQHAAQRSREDAATLKRCYHNTVRGAHDDATMVQ
jgi:hypothetical protein